MKPAARCASVPAALLFTVLAALGLCAAAWALEEEPLDRDAQADRSPVRIPGADAPGREAIITAVAEAAPWLLADYVRIDTTNPPGAETDGARFLQELLDSEGIETKLIESMPGRGSLYARVRGSGKKRPLILLSHIDVVPADEGRWDSSPFSAEIGNGRLRGRGALDAKGVGITQLLAAVAIKRLGGKLERDIILLATADEEAGGAAGVKYLIEKHRKLFDKAEFVLNEGGWILQAEGRPLVFQLAVAEKGVCWFRLRASGEPGHGSRPHAKTATTRLIGALARLQAWERPFEVGPVVAGYYAAAAAFDPERARQFRQLERSLGDKEFHDWFVSDPAAAALIRDTMVPTVLRGAAKTNVVPAEAVAEVDSRMLPGHDCEEFLSEVTTVIGDEAVKVENILNFAASDSPLNTEVTRAVERLAAAEKTPSAVLPTLLTGFTDSHYFREIGIAAYGFVPLVLSADEKAAIHAPNESVRVAELSAAVRRMVALLEDLGR